MYTLFIFVHTVQCKIIHTVQCTLYIYCTDCNTVLLQSVQECTESASTFTINENKKNS